MLMRVWRRRSRAIIMVGVCLLMRRSSSRGVQILASYTEDLHVESGEGQAAVVYRKVGEGHAVVTGPHPE